MIGTNNNDKKIENWGSSTVYKKTSDPTTSDDYSGGYVEGDMWRNVNTGKTFTLFDGSIGVSVWVVGGSSFGDIWAANTLNNC